MGKYVLIVLSFFVFAFTGCDSGSSSGVATSSIAGTSYKGVISNALAEIYGFSGGKKGNLLSSSIVNDSKFKLDNVTDGSPVLVEIKKDASDSATYLDEDSGDSVHFGDLVLKLIVDNPSSTKSYVVTPLTTLASELVLRGDSPDIVTAEDTIAKLFGLSFSNLDSVKPDVEGLNSSTKNSQESEYAVGLLSMIALQNEINGATSVDFTFKDLLDLILKDLSDGVFDGKENGVDIAVQDGNRSLVIGDMPKKLSQAGFASLSKKNPVLLDEMKPYFLKAATATRAIEPPSVEIRADANIKLNTKTILSAKGSISPLGYPLTYSWSVKNSPVDANVTFSSTTDVDTFLTVDTEGVYTISLEVSDGQNRASKDINITADFDGDGQFANVDPDIDGDGILNGDDKFPNNPAEFLDSDNDGVGNFAQLDEDGDGVADTEDDYPFDSTKSDIAVYSEVEFNGNLNQANKLTGDMPFRITGVIDSSLGADDDYFTFSSTSGSIISVSLRKTFEEFEPTISVVDSSGNSLPSISSIADTNMTIVTFRIPVDGEFTLIVTDKNSMSSDKNTYTINIFADNDMDGVSNEYERAIGSNENLSDTDSDGIKDYFEIYTASFDIDSDGIPNWLDDDSDGDSIADSKESLTDCDHDSLLNPFDTDSDGNGIDDSQEVGSNPDSALDSDGDGYADYTDIDDDNDGVWDINDNSRLEFADTNSTAYISLFGVVDSNKIFGFAQAGGVLNITGENFTQNALVVLVDSNGVYNITPAEVNSTDIVVNLPKTIGKALVKVYDNDKLTPSGSVDIVSITNPIVFGVTYPNGQTYALENDIVEIRGKNLSGATSVGVNTLSVPTTFVSDNSVSFVATSSTSSGVVKISTLNGDSNQIPIFIGRRVTGSVVLPSGSSYSFSDLKVEYAGGEYPVDNDGKFSVIVKNSGASSISIFALESQTGMNSLYLSATVLNDQSDNIVVDANSTAVDILFSAFNGEALDVSKQRSMYDIIKDNDVAFAENLIDNLGGNPYYIAEASSSYIDALVQSKSDIEDVLKAQPLSNSAMDIKVNEIDGFSVYKNGDPIDGKLEILNDTMLFADYMITNKTNAKTIKAYTDQFFSPDLLGPQYTGFFLYLSSSTIYDVNYQSSVLTIVTPKFRGMTFDNFNKDPEYILAWRTLYSQGLIPIIATVLPMNLNDSTRKLLLEKVLIPAVSGSTIDYFRVGKIAKGFSTWGTDIVKTLRDDAGKLLLKSLFNISAKDVAKLATKLLGFAVPTKAVEVAGTVVDMGWTVVDFATVSDKITFNIDFPVTIDKIYPTSIKKDGSSKQITIEGDGLEDYCSNFDLQWISGTYFPPRYNNICVSWHYPKVKLSADGNSLEMFLTKTGDKKYSFTIPSSFVEKLDNGKEIDVSVTHVHNDEQYLNELIDITVSAPEKIAVVDKLSISNLTPDSGSAGMQVTISGAGFSKNLLDNRVYFTTENGTALATVVSATESQLTVQVPKDTVTGNVWVQVDNQDSNKLLFTVSTTRVTITFGDNGGLTDDTFSLDFDNGKVVKTTPSPVVTDSVSVEMQSGVNYTVKLTGITAPDAIGTYYISFPSEIEVLSGPALSGSDLTAGVVKTWIIRLASAANTTSSSLNQSIKYTPATKIFIQPE